MIRNLLEHVRGDERAQHRAVDVDLAIDMDVDAALDTLANPRRREVIHRLADLQANEDSADGQPSMDISDLAEYLAALEDDEGIDEAGWNQRQRAYVALYQTHLPKLDERDAIAYDERAGVIAPTDDTVALATLLTMVERACMNADPGGDP